LAKGISKSRGIGIVRNKLIGVKSVVFGVIIV